MKETQRVKFLEDKKLKEANQIYDGVIIQVYNNDLELEPGHIVKRELVHHKAAVAILPILDNNQVILVRQYRPAIAQEILEIPAGILDKGPDENPEEAAKRELEEETGYQANQWQALGTVHISPGFMDEVISLYLAKDLEKVENPLEQDYLENVQSEIYSRTQILEMIQNNLITDLKTLYVLQIWLNS